jgi:hypothetical protein
MKTFLSVIFAALGLAAFLPTKAEAHPHFYIGIDGPVYYEPYVNYGDERYWYYHHRDSSCGYYHHRRHWHDDDDDE